MKRTPKYYMAIDQYNQHYDGLVHPRKDLLNLLDRQHADKMYIDDKQGKSYHCGYIIDGLWLSVYEVIPMRKLA